ncbi:MAG: Holliday junction branch migration protein RuvA [Patescibacteria group bacterium]
MIAHLSGKILLRGNRYLIIKSNETGYKIFVTPEALKIAKNKNEFSLWTHLHVREDALELYGFLEYPELEFFEMLIGISGVGPKSALGIIGVAPLDTLKRAISIGETEYLTKVSGIGRRTAEKIIIELKEKLGSADFMTDKDEVLKGDQDVFQALQSLGYSPRESREALKQIPKDIDSTQDRIKEALKILGKK